MALNAEEGGAERRPSRALESAGAGAGAGGRAIHPCKTAADEGERASEDKASPTAIYFAARNYMITWSTGGRTLSQKGDFISGGQILIF